jgi:hydroxypyruvate isomerase
MLSCGRFAMRACAWLGSTSSLVTWPVASVVENIALLADLYHLAVNGDDPDEVISRHTRRIGHVQIADNPGRNEPGTGDLDIQGYLNRLADNGYDGYVGLEYKPSGASADSFDWLPRDLRA